MSIQAKLLSRGVLFVLACAFPCALAGAQTIKPGSSWYTNKQHGFRFKPPEGYQGIPLQPGQDQGGLVARMKGPDVALRNGVAESSLYIFAFLPPEPDPSATPSDRTQSARLRGLADVLTTTFAGFGKAQADKPELDENVKVGKLTARHQRWKATPGSLVLLLDGWTFDLGHAEVSIAFSVPEERADKFLPAFERAAKSFQAIPRGGEEKLGEGTTYEEKLAKAQQDAAAVAGWRALATPSKKYIVLTSSTNRKFIDEVISRLEKSRELYERDFPPQKEFEHVSIVRICGTEEEFHTYGGTGGGVAGWFNPATTELVLYDAVNVDRNMSYAVMSHEAFHQYCHFLFDESEAHRWFDEGHGDYYGGADFKGSRAVITARMPGGLDRLDTIRELVRSRQHKRMRDHLNFNHPEWQSFGTASYAQSWSIIYMLREGSLGKIKNKRIWKPEYADIIPNYVETLFAGYQEAFEQHRAPIRARAEAEGREPTEEELRVPRHLVSQAQKKEIWDKAIAASWGTIDLEDFEERWLQYVEKELK